MLLVGLSPGNSAFMPIGLFESREQAEQVLLDAGAVFKKFEKRAWNKQTQQREGTGEFGPEVMVVTETFKDWMEDHELNFYSVAGSCDVDSRFIFEEFPVGSISHGYDDD